MKLHIELHESTSHNTITLSEALQRAGAEVCDVNHATATMTIHARSEQILGSVNAIIAQDRHLIVKQEEERAFAS